MPKSEPASRGVWLGFLAYGLWGVFPLYFGMFQDSSSLEILAHRIAWTLLFCVLGLVVVQQWENARAVLNNRRVAGVLGLAGALIGLNWGIYLWAILNDHVVDAALGYFINPLVTVALAVFVLKEKLRRGQIVALAIGGIAVVVLVLGYGQIPWVALCLAITFAVYSFIKNRVGPYANPLVALSIETTVLAPAAVSYIVWAQVSGVGTFLNCGPVNSVLLVLAGAVTAVPLLFFAAAARRVSLTMIGLLQYVSPVMQFIIGVVLNHESMSPSRWAGFALVWCALIVLTWDSIKASLVGREK